MWRPPDIRDARYRPCLNPFRVPGKFVREEFQSGDELEQMEVSCQVCETCIARRVHDISGRAVAESLAADSCWFSTHTFGGDDHYGSVENNPYARKLDYSLMQAFVKRLRYAIWQDRQQETKEMINAAKPQDRKRMREQLLPRMRFLIVGENGKKGRAHFHMITYLKNCAGPPELREAVEWGDETDFGVKINHGKMDPTVTMGYFRHVPGKYGRTYWPWGYSWWARFEPYHARYIAKYITKTADEREGFEAPFVVMMAARSTKPMLGAPFFQDIARQHVEYQIPIQSRSYKLPPETGWGMKTFFMTRAAFSYTCRSFEDQWIAKAKADPAFPPGWPTSPALDQFHKSEFKRLELQRENAIRKAEVSVFLQGIRDRIVRDSRAI